MQPLGILLEEQFCLGFSGSKLEAKLISFICIYTYTGCLGLLAFIHMLCLLVYCGIMKELRIQFFFMAMNLKIG